MVGVTATLAGFLTGLPAQLWLGRRGLTPLTIESDSRLPGWPARLVAGLLTLAALAGAVAIALAT